MTSGDIFSDSAALLFYTLMAVITALISLTLSALFLLNRNNQLIRVRTPWLIVLTFLSFATVCIMQCFRAIQINRYIHGSPAQASCMTYWFIYAVLLVGTYSGLVVRAVQLFFKFNLAEEALAYARLNSQNGNYDDLDKSQISLKRGWFSSHRHLISAKGLLLLLAIPSALVLVPVSIFFGIYGHGTYSLAENCIDFNYSTRFIDIPFGIVCVIGALELQRRLSHAEENFHIQEELMQIVKMILVVGVGLVILIVFQKRLGSWKSDIFNLLYTFMRFFLPFLALSWISVGNILRISYQWQNLEIPKDTNIIQDVENLIPPKPTLSQMRDEMIRMLELPEGFKIFEEFLVKEFSVENILFWKEASDFQEFAYSVEKGEIDISTFVTRDDRAHALSVDDKSNSKVPLPEVLVRRARRIYNTYCRSDSLLLVNLPYGVQNTLKKIFEDVRTTTMELNADENSLIRKITAFTATRTKSLSFLGDDNPTRPNDSINLGISNPSDKSKIPRKKRDIDALVFDAALVEITNLMCSDSFRRFRLTIEYSKFVRDRHRRIQESKQKMNSSIISNSSLVKVKGSRVSDAHCPP